MISNFTILYKFFCIGLIISLAMALLQFSPITLKVAFEIEHNNKHYPDLIRSKKQLIEISKVQLPKEKQWLPQVSPYILQPQCKKPSKPLIFLIKERLSAERREGFIQRSF